MTSTPDESLAKQKNNFSPMVVVVVGMVVIAATNHISRPLFVIWALLATTCIVHLCGIVVAGLLAGAAIEKIEVGFGPRLVTLNFWHATMTIGCIPGGSVAFKDVGMDVSQTSVATNSLAALPLTWRLVIAASGPLALFLLASVCIGSEEAGRSLANCYRQVVVGAIAPLSQGQALLKKALDLPNTQGLIVAIGVLSAKMTAANLLPIPITNGGQFLMEPFRRLADKRPAIVASCNAFGLLLLSPILIGWCIAISKFVFITLRGS